MMFSMRRPYRDGADGCRPKGKQIGRPLITFSNFYIVIVDNNGMHEATYSDLDSPKPSR